MKLRVLTLALLAAFAASASLAAPLVTPLAAAEIKIALDNKPDLKASGSYNWAHAFGKTLKAAGLKVREMPRGSVGNEAEKFDQLSTGLLEVSLSDVRAVAQVDPFIYGLRLPYIFDDLAHMDRALAEGNVLARINAAIAKQDVVLLALAPLGPYSGIITTKTEVRKPADLSGLRMRALDDAQIAMYEAWGSKGTIVPWGEVPAGLQTGVIDGYLNSAFVPILFGQTDFVKHFSDARVIIPLRAVLVSKLWYEGLSAEDRTAVDGAVEAGNAAARAWLAETAVSALTDLEAAGVTVQRLTDAERATFRELSSQVYNAGLLPAEDIATWKNLSDTTR